jgi:hypothetical protein
LQNAAELATTTAEATTELQKQLQKVLKIVSTFSLKQDSQDTALFLPVIFDI